MYINSSNTNAGLFANNAGTIQNIKITDSYVHAKNETTGIYNIGAIVGSNSGIVKKCDSSVELFYEGNNSEATEHVGGIIGYSNGEVIDCNNTGNIQFSVKGKYSRIGGIAGTVRGSLKNCTNKANITGESISNDGEFGGCIAVTIDGNIDSVSNSGKIEIDGKNIYASDATMVGGVIGNMLNSSNAINLKNTGKINVLRVNAKYARVGGTVGTNQSTSIIRNSENNGNIEAEISTKEGFAEIGGVAAINYGSSIIENCKNTGKILYTTSGNNSAIGGIVGENNASTLTYSYTTNDIEGISNCSGKTYIGRIVGVSTSADSSKQTIVTNCYTTGGMNNRGTTGTRYINFFHGYSSGTISKIYYLSETVTEGYDYSVRNFAGTTSNMTKANFIKEIGSNNFKIGTGIYPVLAWE